MAIPDYEELMLPVLRVAGDGQEHRIGDVIEQLAKEFQLTDEERNQLLPSGKQTTFANRVHWARGYLVQAGLLEATMRAHFRITDRGRKALSEGPTRIDNDYLTKFPEFIEFLGRSRGQKLSPPRANEPPSRVGQRPVEALTQSQTPDELLRATVKQIEAALSKELLDRILAAPPAFFERLVVALLIGMGYGGSREGAGQIVGRSGDGGIDGVIDQDALGLDRVYVQAKRYKGDNPVSEPEVRAFSGSLGAAKASKGVFVTTSSFTQPSINFAERHPSRIILIDGKLLTTLMVRYNVGARIDETLYLKKIDEDFFIDE
jgi:restriction system protein